MTVNLGLIKAIFVGSTPPSNTNVLWRDTNVNKAKYYDTTSSSWIALDAGSAAAIWGNVSGILSNQTDLQAALTTLQNQINAKTTQITTIQSSITTINTNLGSLQTQINTLSSASHTQNSDQALDFGGANQVTAPQIKSFISSKGLASGLASLDGSGKVPTSQLPDVLVGALQFQTVWNATSNTPALISSAGTKGYFYIVNVAGTTMLDTINDWSVGDWAVYDGTVWRKVDNSDKVSSVNGQVGPVVLTTDEITEGLNIYFTAARVAAHVDVAANTAARHNKNDDQYTLPSINNLSDLQLAATVSLSVGHHVMYRDETTGLLNLYKLVSGVDAQDSPSIIRPGDFDLVTNQKVWLLATTSAGNGDMLRAVYDTDNDGVVNASFDSVQSTFIANSIFDAGTLKALSTFTVDLNRYALYKENSTSLLRVYRLESGTDAESAPDVLRPDDYAATTNEKVWRLAVTTTNVERVSKVISTTAHGFSTGFILTIDNTGAYVKLTSTSQLPVGVVLAIDLNTYELVSSGLITGLSGLTPGATYYIQSTGVLSTTPSPLKYMIAKSATSGYLLSILDAGATVITGLANGRANFNASSGAWPTTGGSGVAGAIEKWNMWKVTTAGYLGGEPVTANVNSIIIAMVDGATGDADFRVI